MYFFLTNSLFIDEEYSWFIKNSDMNFWIVFLVFVLYLIVLIVEISYKIRLNLLFISLVFIIYLSDLVLFFFFYEIVFLLIMFTIILLGYSYERLIASFLIIFYSFLFSSPVLILLLLFDHRFLIKEWLIYSGIIIYFFVGSFIVKFPIFGFHYWLPVAHVEASTVGSILLAGILLKLGSVGLMYVIIYINFIVKFHWLALGVILIIIVIIRLRDLKIIIAYSSVAHITIVFYVIIIGHFVGKKGAICIIFYHGFISPLIFWVVGILAWWKTRSLIVIKIISFSYLFLICVFFLCILNIGFPPFLGFMSEILIIKSLINNYLVLRIIIFGILLRCYYNIYLFWCFNGFIGIVFKLRFFRIDLFMFLILGLLLNLFWLSILYDILWLCRNIQ
jgi:NADH:ubiquinone oxidoreductase subunit 4 (subunit M)